MHINSRPLGFLKSMHILIEPSDFFRHDNQTRVLRFWRFYYTHSNHFLYFVSNHVAQSNRDLMRLLSDRICCCKVNLMLCKICKIKNFTSWYVSVAIDGGGSSGKSLSKCSLSVVSSSWQLMIIGRSLSRYIFKRLAWKAFGLPCTSTL